MNALPYTKMSGAGNTFIMMEGEHIPEAINLAQLAPDVCSDQLEHGGADGFIAIYHSADEKLDFTMKYFNRDGSTGMMCGNGGRCAVQFAFDKGYASTSGTVRFTNTETVYHAEATEFGIKLHFPDPKLFKLSFKVNFLGGLRTCHYADVGTPHAIMIVDEVGDPRLRSVDQLDLNIWGKELRSRPDFAPEGANANFLHILPEKKGIKLRTYERGVEAETGACGTGAISSAIIASTLRDIPPPVSVTTSSGQILRVDFRVENRRVTNVSLEGNAEVLSTGTLSLPRP